MLGMGLILDMYLPKVNSLIHFFLVFFASHNPHEHWLFSCLVTCGCGASRIREGAAPKCVRLTLQAFEQGRA